MKAGPSGETNLGNIKTKKEPATLPELPTAERLSKGHWREEFLSPKPGSPKRLRSLNGDELTRLLFLEWISPDSHSTLTRFQRELKEAGLIFSVRSSVYPSSTANGGGLIADAAFLRARRVSDQQTALAKGLNEIEHRLVLAALTMDQPLSKDGAEIMTRAAGVLNLVYGV